MSSTNLDQISRRAFAGRKRPFEAGSHAKRLRSKIPRRKRIPLLPIVNGDSNSVFDVEVDEESSSSCFHSELSFDSNVGLAGSEVLKRPRSCHLVKGKKPITSFHEETSADEFRRITRSYAKKKIMQRSDETMKNESGRGGNFSSGSRAGKKILVPETSDGNAASEIAISEVSQVSGGFPDGNLKKKGVASETTEKFPEISESSGHESVSEANNAKIPNSTADQRSGFQIFRDLSVRNEEAYDLYLDSDLACSEQLSNEEDESSEYSTCNEMTLSEFESELFHRSSKGDSSEYSLSVLFESPEDFSERSSENSAPSATFSLFLQLKQQFMRSSSRADSKAKPGMFQADSSEEYSLLSLEEDDDEESYKRFRSRERNDVVLPDFAEEYSSTTDYGDLILQQRLLMVNWVVEHSKTLELQHETLFLGVSLMDRFLSRGYFENERNLQLLGIASVTLATRLEENQPYNSIRQKSFTVGSNVYNRCEVVAMEWLLLEVLNFQCFLPTTHNFLWFYLKAAKADAEVEALSRYLAVLSLLDHERLCFWPSTVAAGLVILACLATNRDSSCHMVMETHVRTKNDDLPECIQSLEWLVKYAC